MYTRMFSALSLPLGGAILGISGLKYFIGSRNYKPPCQIIAPEASITQVDYPQIDMRNLPYHDEQFDVVIADQVIEHIEGDVQQAVNEARRVLKKEGILIMGTAFIHPIHYGPKDMWRFSPDALRYLCRDFSEIIQCEGWGNRFVHALFFLYPPARDWQVPKRRWSFRRLLVTYNDNNYPHSTWIIARK